MNISTTDAFGLYTKKLIEVYKERTTPTSFLRSFFRTSVEPTLELSIEVQRGSEKVAVDVIRGTEGNRNQATRSTEKIFIPPAYKEYMDVTKVALWDRLFGATQIDDKVFARLINNIADGVMGMQEKIERAIELQCSQVLETGIVTLVSADNIDYKRKTASKVDLGTGNYFTDAIDPFDAFQDAGVFLRQKGKVNGRVLNAIMGNEAITALFANTKFKERQNLFHMSLDAVAAPQQGAVGQTYHGRITAGPYLIDLWSYPEYYDLRGGTASAPTFTSTPYLNPKKVIVLPENPKFVLGYAVCEQLIKPGEMPIVAPYLIREFPDTRKAVLDIEIQSAPLAIPIAIDQIYTFQAVA